MGFNSCILPSIERMEEEIDSNGLDVFVKLYSKYDSISGETDRVEFLEMKMKEYYDKQP